MPPKQRLNMEDLTKSEKSNRRQGLAFSLIFHTLMVILAALYGFTFQMPPPEAGGVQVNLGIPDVGQGDENAPASTPTPAEETPAPEEETEEEEVPPTPEKPEPVKEKPREKPKETKKQPVTTQDEEAAALRQKEKEAREKAEAADRQRKAEEARKKADEDRKRQEEAQRQKELSDLVSGGLGGSKGSGKGNTGKPGNQGDPNGDPNSDILTGISTGSGVLGGGLGSRGVLKKGPTIKDNSQASGDVMISLCVDRNGAVIGEPEYTQRGSTTADSRLVRLAIQNAKQWKFEKGEVDKECGTIRYEFKLK